MKISQYWDIQIYHFLVVLQYFSSSLTKGYEPPPLVFTFGHIRCYYVIPVHCHLMKFVSCVLYNDLIFSQSAQGIHVKICIRLTENSKCVPKRYSLFFGSPSWQNLHVPILCLHFTYTETCVFETHISDQLQLSLTASSFDGNHK